ncbi:cache domain-containing protein [Roseateles flavus]|uniref:Cache domain-containing protein n=1 Tax=Roseateles flavus TaxID=3149041 RepID=A0ABV0GHA8_9BURK
MKLRGKILLLAIAPLLASLALIAVGVRQQEGELVAREHATVQRAYMEARRDELRHYVDLALSTVQPLYAQAQGQDALTRRHASEQALQRLATLDYGADGYFFVYDLQGRVLMHSRQPELLGQNLWELRDARGQPTIQRLIAQARAGGGYVEYLWRKPSSQQMAPKLGYVVALPEWNWMMGTGLYLDGIQATLDQLDREAQGNIARTLWWIVGIALAGIVLISASALALNLSEHRLAEQKLRLLAHEVVRSQEEERAHLARELHDGISQTLVSTKLLVEANLREPRPALLQQAVERLSSSLHEVRRISHRLRPALLDTLGLDAALEHLARECETAGGPRIDCSCEPRPLPTLPEVAVTVLFRVAQEALTNALKHAQAGQVLLQLQAPAGGDLSLVVQDDGQGFDLRAQNLHPQQGIGLRNMRERLAAIGGQLDIQTRPGHGTWIEARLPAEALARLASDNAVS